MPVDVVVEASPTCPVCKRAVKELRELAGELGVPLSVRYLETRALSASWGSDSVTREMYNPDSPWAKNLSKEAKEILRVMYTEGYTLYPVIRVRWGPHYERELVIRGWREELRERLAALLTFLLSTG